MNVNFSTMYTKFYQLTDHTPCKVDTPKRLGGYVLDWVIGGIFTGMPAVFLYSGITQKSDFFSDLYVFESLGYARSWAYLAGILCLLFALFYFVFIPWKIFPGQTLGKRIAGFKIVKTSGAAVDLPTLLLRQVIGLLILESAAFIASNYLRQLTSLTLHFYVDYVWSILGMVITLISVILVLRTDSHRALHDYLAKTTLVLVNKAEEPKEKASSHNQKSTKKPEPSKAKKAVEPSAEKYLPKKQRRKGK